MTYVTGSKCRWCNLSYFCWFYLHKLITRWKKSDFVSFWLFTAMLQPSSPCGFSKSSVSHVCHKVHYANYSLTYPCPVPSCLWSAQYTPSTLALPPSCIWKKTNFVMDEPKAWQFWCYVRFCYKPGKDAIALYLRLWEFSWKHMK